MRKIFVFFVLAFLALFIGCNINIFSPFHNPDNDTSLQSLLADGEAALENQDYENALKYYQKAIDNYPYSGKARLGYSEAYVGYKNVDFIELFNILNDDTAADSEPILPFNKISFYNDVASKVMNVLLPIMKGKCDIDFNDTEANLDIALTSMLKGSLVVFDINGNGNFNDPVDILYLGHDLNVYGFDKITSLTSSQRDELANSINGAIDRVLYIINISTTALNNAFSSGDLMEDSEDFINDVNDTANTVAHQIEYYRYKDGIDNDGDWVDVNQNSQYDTMIWTDDNGNGTIDDPSGQPWTLDRVKSLSLPLDSTWFSTNGGEWKGGDWGVDEEIIDGIDNDGDGIVDEDSGGHI